MKCEQEDVVLIADDPPSVTRTTPNHPYFKFLVFFHVFGSDEAIVLQALY